MTLAFKGQTIVITGAAGGIGRAAAERLHAQGANVVAVDSDAERLVDTVTKLGERAIAFPADISDEAAVEGYMKAARDAFGSIDGYFLNAGIFGDFSALPDISLEQFERVMSVNVTGQFLGLRAAFRQFREQGTIGNIVVTASIGSLTGSADLLPYQTSKHAVTGLVHGAAVFGGPLGIRVNAVAPGIVPTDLFAAAATSAGGKNDMPRRASTTPLRRAGTPEEIASVVTFLLSEDSGYVTGQLISADGGATIVNTVRPSGGAGAWDTASHDDHMYESWTRGTK